MGLFDLTIKLPDTWIPWFKKKKTVLIIEDDSATAKLIQNGAEKAGFGVVLAEDEHTALGILRDNGKKFVLVLIDVNILGSNGWDLRRLLIDQYPTMLICMMSATRTALQDFPNGDATLVLEKPSSYSKVFRELKRLI